MRRSRLAFREDVRIERRSRLLLRVVDGEEDAVDDHCEERYVVEACAVRRATFTVSEATTTIDRKLIASTQLGSNGFRGSPFHSTIPIASSRKLDDGSRKPSDRCLK